MKKKLNCVLLVDDDESDNFFHNRILEKAGITDHIEIALNGKEALDFLTTKAKCEKPESSYCQPELIFLDINMPVMDGWEFLEQYHKLPDIQKGKIIIVMLTTSHNISDTARAEKKFNIGWFKNKPLTMQMINEIMQYHFPDYI
jgi:CheY-like chemotaxis protein